MTAKHTPQLAARFSGTTASVVDLSRPNKTRVGYEVLADFSRDEYDANLAYQLAAAPELLSAARAISHEAGVLTTDEDQPVLISSDNIRALRAAIAYAEGSA